MIDQEKVDELKAQLIEACDKYIADGGTISTGAFVGSILGDKPRRCPVGCLSGGTNYFRDVNAILGLPDYDMTPWEFVEAFDGRECRWPTPLQMLGQELRAKYLNK
jgi:hypothetical protein